MTCEKEMTVNLSLHATGASFIAMCTEHNPRDLVIELIESMQGEQRDKMFEEFRRRISENDRYQRAVDWYFFVNMHDYLTTSRNKHQTPQQRAHAKQAADECVTDLKRKIVDIVLLDIILPSGKRLRDSTFAECGRAGGWFTKLAKMGKPAQVVGKVLTEAKLKAIK